MPRKKRIVKRSGSRANDLQRALDTEEWKHIDNIRRRLEQPIIAEMIKIFEEQEEEVIQAIEGLRMMDRAGFMSLDKLFNAPKWLTDTWNRVKQFALGGVYSGYEVGQDQTGVDLPDLDDFDPSVKEVMSQVEFSTQNVTRTTAESISEVIEDALRNQWTPQQTVAEMKSLFAQHKITRPKVIGQTIMTAVHGRGQIEAFSRAGFGKSWLSRRDGRVRDTHSIADGQRRSIREPFSVGRALLQHPGDPDTNVLSEIMGCRCGMKPVKQ